MAFTQTTVTPHAAATLAVAAIRPAAAPAGPARAPRNLSVCPLARRSARLVRGMRLAGRCQAAMDASDNKPKLKGPKEMEMFAMTAAAGMMDPSVKAKIEALVELTDLEYGLTGVRFEEVMDMMDQCYRFTPTEYSSGVGLESATTNAANTNNGSCKVFAFGKLNNLGEEATLSLFCEHYEQVKGDPDGDTHLNIRNFMKNGWEGITFAANGALVAKERLDDPTSTDGI